MKAIFCLAYKVIGYLVLLLIFCEFILHYLVQWNCSWPTLDPYTADKTISPSEEAAVRVMFLTDTHLIGSRNGYWLDKHLRDWQMHRAFQTAITLHQPEIVFFLGDLTDEGWWCGEEEFQDYVKRFHRLFAVPQETKMYIVVGNHDIGFHYSITSERNERFVSAFDSPSVRLVSVRGVHFVLVNSMALEGDGCFLCRPAEQQLQHIGTRFKCTNGTEKCQPGEELNVYSRPILVQHFPLYRESDVVCDMNEVDIAPMPLRTELLRERWDCLSREASLQLLDMLRPRLAISGHTHNGCKRIFSQYDAIELTIASFSWRNRNNPNYMLVLFTTNNYATARCELPRQSTIIVLYTVAIVILALWFAVKCRRLPRIRTRMFKTGMTGKERLIV